MAKDLRIYVQALLARKAPPRAGARVPRLERIVPPHVPSPARVASLRALLEDAGTEHLPLTYPHVAAFQTHIANMADPRFPLAPMGVVHVRNRLVQRRPIRVGEPLRCICAIDGVREVEKGREFDLETKAYVGAELVWESWSTMLARRRDLGAAAKSAPKPLDLTGPDAADETWAVTPALARRYAWVGDDLNPIHLSAVTARLFGFRAPLLHGMWSVGRIAARHAALTARAVELACDFKRPVLLPARLVHRHWASGPDGALAVRVLDEGATTPHLVGTLQPL